MLLLCFCIGFIFFFHLLRLFYFFAIRSIVVLLAQETQIAGFVIADIAVNVVHCSLVLWVIVLTECSSHKSANKKMPAYSVMGQADTVIALVIGERCQNLFFLVFQGFDSAKGTDIIFFITVYRFPDFFFYWYHLLFYSLRNRKEELNKFDKKICNFIKQTRPHSSSELME